MASDETRERADDLLRQLRIPELKSVLRSLHMPVSGNRGALVERIRQDLELRWPTVLDVLEREVQKMQRSGAAGPWSLSPDRPFIPAAAAAAAPMPRLQPPQPPQPSQPRQQPAVMHASQYSVAPMYYYAAGQAAPLQPQMAQMAPPPQMQFLQRKLIPCPFITNPVSVMSPRPLPTALAHICGDSHEFQLHPSHIDLLNVRAASLPYRVYLRCGVKSKNTQPEDGVLYHKDMFPRNAFWTINSIAPDQDQILGRSRPLDITDFLLESSGGYFQARNTLVARKVTSQPFTYDDSVIEVVIGQLVTAEDLLKQARTLCQAEGEEFVKHKLKPDDLTEAAASDDIVPAFMQNITLLCPLTLSRMTHPGRGAKCEHLQCFDLLSYLKMNERKPGWACPVCQKPLWPKDLVRDEYTQNILRTAPSDTHHIRLLADATWQTISEPPSKRSKTGPSRSESEADRDDTPPPPGLGIPGAAERANAISALAAQLEAESQQPTARGTADDPLVLD